MGGCDCSVFCCTLLYVHSRFASIMMGKRAGCFAWFVYLVSGNCCVPLPRGAMGLSAVVIVIFPDHTHLLFLVCVSWRRTQRSDAGEA